MSTAGWVWRQERVNLEGVALNSVRGFTQGVGNQRQVELRSHGPAKAFLTFQDRWRAGEPLLSEQSCQKSVLGRLARMQVLGHGAVRQEFPKPGGLGAGIPQGPNQLLRAESEKFARGG